MTASSMPMRDRTLPASCYLDPLTFELERQVVFGEAWQLAAFSTDVAAPGSYATGVLGDRSFLVTRDDAGTLRAFHNVCQHRGATLASGCGRRKTVQCDYHGWTYGLDGGLRRAPGMRAPSGGVRLRQVHVEERAPFVFVSPADDPPPFDDAFASLFAYLAEQRLDLAAIAARGRPVRRTFDLAANWKIVMENSLECYHCSIAHPGIADTLDLDRYAHRLERWWSVQGAPMRTTSRKADGALGATSRAAARSGNGFEFSRFVFVYPNLFFEIYPGSASFAVLIVRPLNAVTTRSEHVKFLAPDVDPVEEAEWDTFVDQVIREDIALCERVQDGMRSGAIEAGILNLYGEGANEACIGHFVALLADALGVD